MSNQRFRKLRAKVKTLLDFTDKEVLEWWLTPIEAFNGKTPSEMSASPETFKQMEEIIFYSELDISGGIGRNRIPIEALDDDFEDDPRDIFH